MSENDEFKQDIIEQVSNIVRKQDEQNRKNWDKFDQVMTDRLERALPAALKTLTPKNNYWFPVLTSILNGVAVGLSVFVAFKVVGI